MKIENTLEYSMNHLKNHEPFKVIFDGEDFGIYKYEPEYGYVGIVGHIPMEGMVKAIKDKNYFIKVIPV